MATSGVVESAGVPEIREKAPAGSRAGRGATSGILFYVVLVILGLVFVAPLLWMISTSFKTAQAATQQPLSWLASRASVASSSSWGVSSVSPGRNCSVVLRWLSRLRPWASTSPRLFL